MALFKSEKRPDFEKCDQEIVNQKSKRKAEGLISLKPCHHQNNGRIKDHFSEINQHQRIGKPTKLVAKLIGKLLEKKKSEYVKKSQNKGPVW